MNSLLQKGFGITAAGMSIISAAACTEIGPNAPIYDPKVPAIIVDAAENIYPDNSAMCDSLSPCTNLLPGVRLEQCPDLSRPDWCVETAVKIDPDKLDFFRALIGQSVVPTEIFEY